jgi:toxin-antitoxin system PIN domain toxin
MSGDVLLDVNVLVAVLRQDHVHHGSAVTWCMKAQAGPGAVVILAESLVAAVRVLASDRIWSEPTPPPDAVRALDAFIEAMDARIVGADLAAWQAFGSVASSRPLTARMVPDALLAAAAWSYGATLVTFDRGMSPYSQAQVSVLG